MRYVAVYCRISKDKTGRVEGVRAQERWGREYAAGAWPDLSVRVFADNDLSAAGGDRRPGFEDLRVAIAAGEVAHLWTVEQSRLERTEVGWFQLAAELDAAGIGEVHTNRDGIVRVRDEVAGIKAVISAGEVRKLKKRVNERLATIAAEGRPSGATVFGYRHGADAKGGKTLIVVESEAAVIRDAADKILSGWSLSRVAAELRAAGWLGSHRRKVRDEHGEVVKNEAGKAVTTPTTITATTVRSMVTNHAVAGLRVHQGRVAGRGVWAPILDERTWNAVRARLAAPRVVDRSDGGTYRLTPGVRATARRYLLTGGTAVCGVCGHPLIATMRQLKSGRVPPRQPYYICHPTKGGRACVGIMAELFEAFVVAQLLDELDRPAFRDSLAEDDHAEERDRLTAELTAIEGQRNELAGMWGRRELSAAEWQTARRALAEHEREVRGSLAAVPVKAERIDLTAIRQGWDAMVLDEQREIISMFVARVVVLRATPGRKGFDPGRVSIEWRHANG